MKKSEFLFALKTAVNIHENNSFHQSKGHSEENQHEVLSHLKLSEELDKKIGNDLKECIQDICRTKSTILIMGYCEKAWEIYQKGLIKLDK